MALVAKYYKQGDLLTPSILSLTGCRYASYLPPTNRAGTVAERIHHSFSRADDIIVELSCIHFMTICLVNT